MSENAFEAVVIGSGLGGLTAAALLARAGRKVCVIERNNSVGGAASAFRKGALTIEPALHQTADPHYPGDPKHWILKTLGLLDEIEWIPVSPFYSVRGGPIGEIFDLPTGFDAARQALSKRFPRNAGGFAKLLGAMEHVVEAGAELSEAREEHSLGKLIHGLFEARGLVADWRASTAEIFERHLGADEAAKYAIGANLGYYSDDARRLAWPFFAFAQGGCLKAGGRFIKGGSRVLSMKLAKVVTAAGGKVLLGREAKGIGLDSSGHLAFVAHIDPKAKEDEQKVEARQVFANCAPHVLAPMLPDAERAKIEGIYLGRPLSLSAFSAHFGLSVPPARFGLDRYTRLSSAGRGDSFDHARRERAIARLGSWQSVARLRIRQLRRDRQRTYRRRSDTMCRSPGSTGSTIGRPLAPQEKDRRERWLDAFQNALDRDYPGFGAAVVERTFLNARSMASFMNVPDGAIEGFAAVPFEHGVWAGFPGSPRTPIPGLYLASSFTAGGGFSGAMMGGAHAARIAMRERALIAA